MKAAVEAILQTEIPLRVTMSRVGKSIGLLAVLEQHLKLMPETGDYLAGVVESIDDFQIRRMRWTVNELDRRGEPVIEWRVIRLAGLGDDVNVRVKACLDVEINSRF